MLTKWRHKTEGLTSSQRLQVYEVLHNKWVDKGVQFSSRYNFLSLLIDSKVAFVVDQSFYPTKSYLISAAWFVTVDTKIIAWASFILSVAEEYRYSFTAELCTVLSIIVCIDSILSRYPHPTTAIIIEIGSDCSNILDSLRISIPIISMNKHLHQVIREIHLIKIR